MTSTDNKGRAVVIIPPSSPRGYSVADQSACQDEERDLERLMALPNSVFRNKPPMQAISAAYEEVVPSTGGQSGGATYCRHLAAIPTCDGLPLSM